MLDLKQFGMSWNQDRKKIEQTTLIVVIIFVLMVNLIVEPSCK